MAERSRIRPPSAGWQTLGELFLPVGIKQDHALEAWLRAALDHLNLPASFQRRVFSSAGRAVERAFLSAEESGSKQISLLLYASTKELSGGQAWGFCQLERNKIRLAGEDLPEPVIEIYLYLEG